ncbi:Sialin [Fragariocoptes setiger]|uniref:Sialin n=1 Tax=Fragariocoptes setiger TaxID=1670756 RepID=A0ABQ7SB57_9ACAR|nr:Sialin [Fragariocoptes setiger]
MAKATRDNCCGFSIRYLIIILATLCPVICYISRLNLSMAIVAMVNEPEIVPPPVIAAVTPPPPTSSFGDTNNFTNAKQTGDEMNAKSIPSESAPISLAESAEPALIINNNDSTPLEQAFTSETSTPLKLVSGDFAAPNTCPAPMQDGLDGAQAIKAPTYGPKYDWTNIETGHITSAFFWTYVLCQIPMARLAEIVGAKWIMAGAGIGSFILSLVAPLAADTGVLAFSLTRAIMGACQTAMFPAGYILYSKWLPPAERSIALPILVMGAYIGSIVSSTLTGVLCESPLGWPSVFYLSGAACGLWSLAWVLLSASEPRAHKCISLSELQYIESRMETTNLSGNDVEQSGSSAAPKRPSWRKILTSKAVWSLNATFFSSNCAFAVIMLLLPQFLNYVLRLPVINNGLINSAIFGAYIVSSLIVSSVCQLMIQTRSFGMTRLQIRKLFEGTAILGSSLCFAIMPCMGCNQTFVIGLLFVQIACYSLINGGEVQLPSELTLDFSGTIYALANSIGSSTGFLVPIVHGWIVTDRNDRDQWNSFFYLAAFVTAVGGVIFLIWGSNHMQDFAHDDDDIRKEPAKTTTGQSIVMIGVNDKKHKLANNDRKPAVAMSA